MLMHYGGYAISRPELLSLPNYLIGGGISFIGPVSIFFFLSGYGLMKSESKRHLSTAAFIKHRFSKIYIPVILVTILWLPIFATFVEPDYFSTVTFGKLFRAVTIDFLDGALWFIQALLLLYLAFQIFAQVKRRNITVGFIVLFALTIGIQIITHRYIAPFASFSVMMFFLGIVGAQLSTEDKNNANIMALMLILYGCIGYFIYDSKILVCNCAVLILLNYFITYLPKVTSRMPLCPAILVALSFDIYITHYKLIAVMTKETAYNVGLLMFVIVSITTALLFHAIRSALLRIDNMPKLNCR